MATVQTICEVNEARVNCFMPRLYELSEYQMPPTLMNFHAHVYFTDKTIQHVEAIYNRVATELTMVKRGTFHTRKVGPHPEWMFTLSFDHANFQTVTLWLMEHLNGLSTLVHPLSGDDLQDHTRHALWFGQQLDLYLDKL